jgi:transposase
VTVFQHGGVLMAARRYEAVIPSNRSRKIIIPHDELAYLYRNRIERCFNRMKHFRRFATRYDRRTINFQRFVYLVATIIWLR